MLLWEKHTKHPLRLLETAVQTPPLNSMHPQMVMARRYIAAYNALDSNDQEYLKSRWGNSGTINIDLSGLAMPLNEAEPADVFEYIFGDRNETPNRAEFLLASTNIGRNVEAGWNGPRTKANNGIDTLGTTRDVHSWCIDKDNGNKILDYPDDQLAPTCEYKTDHVVRQAWSKALADEIHPRLERESRIYIQKLINEKGSVDEVFKAIENNTFPLQYCTARAFLLYSSNPSKYEVVIGAFGFVQPDGRTFWECG